MDSIANATTNPDAAPRQGRAVNPENLPTSVRYVKNGPGGGWWATAKKNAQIHAGWNNVARELLEAADLDRIRALPTSDFGKTPGAATNDRNALLTLIDRPSQHLWVTFQDGDMWWCTVRDGVETSTGGSSAERGNFWLTCAMPWSNRSLTGQGLAMTDLPGPVTATAGFRATVCEPRGWKQILRVICGEKHDDVIAAIEARQAYQIAVQQLVRSLGDKDFEVLIDLILARRGWVRIAKIGGAREGIDIEVDNPTLNEIAFVQIKSRAGQPVLDDYLARFNAQRSRYSRMIFAVHTEEDALAKPAGEPVQIWDGPKIAELAVRSGLGDWLANRIG